MSTPSPGFRISSSILLPGLLGSLALFPSGEAQEAFPFNLVWDANNLAPGGFPRNPRWQWQAHHNGQPSPSICHYFSNGDGDPSYADCTNQTHAENLPEDWNGWVCRVHNWFGEGFPGHLNRFTVTYEGQAAPHDTSAML